ncbi:ABC transporter ATP-binding protein [Nocardioides sp.]|uniref:ABC transporter ATP-binding protein n=1 Tax=Nocardioides sp. TaxID=35761 RepID=UPI003513E592
MSDLSLEGVTHHYPRAEAATLSELSLHVPAGRMLAVVGPSGSGKSTLLRVVAGLERPAAGRVLLGGTDVTEVPTEQRDLTVMFQAPLLFDHLDVLGNIAFGPRMAGLARREARRAAERYLRLVHLDDLARRRVGELSGGQQQRVALARALAARRGVLLLDEPFSSLDRPLRAAMHELLGEVRRELSPTVVIVTHDLDEAARADEVAVLVDGRVQQQAAMAELHSRPATLAVARLVGGFTEVPGSIDGGVHRSVWGAVRLADGCQAVDGPATLLLRREALRVADPALPAASTAAGVEARVVGARAAGPRTLLALVDDDGHAVEVELGVGVTPPPAGARLRVVLDEGADVGGRWAISG